MSTGYLSPELATQERRLALRCGRLDTSGGGATPTRASPSLYIIHHHTNPGHQVAIPGEKDPFRLSVWKRCWSHKHKLFELLQRVSQLVFRVPEHVIFVPAARGPNQGSVVHVQTFITFIVIIVL